MKGITTIAALPSGAGQAAHLKAEVGEAKPVIFGVDLASGPDTCVIREGNVITYIRDGHVVWVGTYTGEAL